ncbi:MULTISPECIES: TlpA disulfide reductase family protein [unclassified Imperialibacter]|uniref:TlpA disulfide reductase family protein n=1 Tax=unclassified Imperialibacter TaxID=2629706 RepID=UPI0018698A36|nr:MULTISPECIES: TlpA disulfide reductase family protein [unclassified Imperialibacter]
MLSIRNTGRYKWYTDDTDEKIRYQRCSPTSKEEFDSLVARTAYKLVISEKIGTLFTYFDFVDVDGKVYKKSDLQGKVLVINFWFVGCAPCMVEMPELNQLYNNYKNNRQIVFLALAKSSEAKVRRFLERKTFYYPAVSMTDEVREEFRITAFPTNYVVDKNGMLTFATQGIGAGAVHLLKTHIASTLEQ